MALNLSPEEKWLLIGGAGVVAIAVFLHAKSSSSAAVAPASSGSTTTPTAPISTGTLANFQSALTAQQDAFLSQIQSMLSQSTPAAPGTTTQTSPQPTVTTIGGQSSPSSSGGASSPAPSAVVSQAPATTTPPPSSDTVSAASAGALAIVPGPGASALAVLGQISGSGGQYTGENVKGGAPVYALVNGSWVTGFDAAQLAPGTPLATSITNAGSIVPGSTTETL